MDAGKRFERAFHLSLKLLPGWSMRIEDGGAKAKNPQWGDFFYFGRNELAYREQASMTYGDYDGNDHLIECKATKEVSFPCRNLHEEQMNRLMGWEKLGSRKHAWLAINYYSENIRERNHCVLIPISSYIDWLDEADRKSLPFEAACGLGKLLAPIRIKQGSKTVAGWGIEFD